MLISDFLNKDCIRVNMQCSEKEEVLKQLAELQFSIHPEIDREETMASLFERENLLSTGIGEGIAIPHARIESCTDILVSFGLLGSKVNFESLDDKPVRIVLLILFPKDKVNLQLRFLARVSRVLHDTSLLEKILACSSPEEVVDTFRQYEELHFH